MRLGVVGFAALGCVAACDAPPLAPADQPALAIAQPSADFGVVTFGNSAMRTLTVEPSAGSNTDTVTAVAAECPQFAIKATGLPATVSRTCDPTVLTGCVTETLQDYAFTAVYTPAVIGLVSCVVHVTLDGGDQELLLTAHGEPQPIQLAISPPSVAFGDIVAANASTVANVVVSELGPEPLAVSAAVSAHYKLTTAAMFTVQPSSSATIGVTCEPPAAGSADGTLTLTTNDPQNGTVVVPLTCAGVTSNVTLDPAPAVFAATQVGKPVMESIAPNGVGAAPITFGSASVTGAGFSVISAPAAGSTLEASPKINTAIVVGFDAAVHGTAHGTLSIATSDGTRTEELTATAQQGILSLTPDGIVDFGPICVGAASELTFAAVDEGDGPFTLAPVAISAGSAEFAVNMVGATGGPLAPGGTDDFEFVITAKPTAPGPFSGSATVSTNIPNGSAHEVDLVATGLGSGLLVTPASADLGTHTVATTSAGQAIVLSNCAADGLVISSATLGGSDAAEFALTAEPTDTALGALANATWVVAITPATAGVKHAELDIVLAAAAGSGSGASGSGSGSGSGSTQMIVVPLVGEGFVPAGSGSGSSGDSTIDQHNYYSCAAGDGAGGIWLLGVAVAISARRRRRGRAA